MSIDEFYEKVAEVFPTIPTFFEIIEVEEGDELPPNYLYFTSGTTEAFGADNMVYWSSTPIELMAVQANPVSDSDTLVQELEQFLNENKFIYSKDVDNDPDIRATVTTFSFSI